MPHLLEVAPTGRAKCRGCNDKIAAKELRFGERLPNPFSDDGGEMTHWFHLTCAAYRRPEALVETIEASTEEIPDRERLLHEAKLGITFRRLPRVSTADRAPTGRATCRACKTLIDKDAWRIALMYYEDGRFTPSGYMHTKCVKEYLETTEIRPRLAHFSPALSAAELDEILTEVTQA
jgi:hypothetical protein